MNASLTLKRVWAGVLFFVLLMNANIYACDMSTFVQSEFAERCQFLLNLCEKADLARSLGHPDIQKHTGALSREWVRFYLAHGNEMNLPPTLSFVASGSWNVGMSEIGHAISRLINVGIDRGALNRLKFRIILLKEPSRIEKLKQVFANRSKFVEQNDGLTEMKVWLENALLVPATILFDQLSGYPYLLDRLRTDVDSHIATFERIKESERAGTDPEVVAGLFGSLQNEINFDIGFWETLFFYSTK
ncbi:MAG: hypothetical protein KKB51_04840 [Candidatus Riflebacteria bacterium]|nr:hypothetical protein [Candidatus Riflebacteria bacterium]